MPNTEDYVLGDLDAAIVFLNKDNDKKNDQAYLVLPKPDPVDLFGKHSNMLNALVSFRVLTDPECVPLIKKHLEIIENAVDMMEDEDE